MLMSFLHSMHVWFFWHINNLYIGFLISVLVLFYVLFEPVKLKFSFFRVLAVILLFIAYNLGSVIGVKSVITKFLIILPVIVLIHIEDKKIHKELLDFIANFFAVLIPISLLVFGLSFVGLPVIKYIPPPIVQYGSDFRCYIFAMRSNFYGIRFASIFLEPGHLGMISAYLLYALNFNLKDIRVIIILIGTLFTLSLAAYVLVILGFVLHLYANKKLKISYIVSGFLFFAILYGISITYNDGDNLLYNAFFARLEPSEDKLIAGNNRTYGKLDDFYELALEHKELVLWGIGHKNFEMIAQKTDFGGAGIKVFMLRQGLVALISVFMAYVLMGLTISKKNKRYLIGFIILLSFSFLQRAYPFWTSWLIPFILGIHNFNILQEKDEN